MEDNTILCHITEEQAQTLCRYYNKDIRKLEEYEIAGLVDRAIDDIASLLEN